MRGVYAAKTRVLRVNSRFVEKPVKCRDELNFGDYVVYQELKVLRYDCGFEMRLAFNILISILAGLLSAVLGWFCGYGIGVLLERIGVLPEPSDQSLGTGLPTVVVMYIATLVFGIVGFVVCLLWRYKKSRPIPLVR